MVVDAPPNRRRALPLRLTPRRLLVIASVLVVALALVSLFHDAPAVARALREFRWRLLAPAVALAAGSYMLRMFRWHLYARRVAGAALRTRDSMLIFGAGVGTALTPARVGEAVRCVFLKRAAGTPIARSAPIILAERVMDGVSLLALALPGAALLGLGGKAAVALLTVPMLIVPLLAWERAHRAAVRIAGRLPLLDRVVDVIEEAGNELRGFLSPRVLLPALVLSLAAMALEVGTYAVVLDGAGVTLTPESYLRAAFALSTALMAAAVFIVPGNVGVAEGGLAAIVRTVIAIPEAAAAGAAILQRVLTLWLGFLIGLIPLAIATRRWGRPATDLDEMDTTD